MNVSKQRKKHNRGNRYIGLLVVLILSIITLLWFLNSPTETLSARSMATPLLKLATNDISPQTNATPSENTNKTDDLTNNDNLILVNKQNPVPNNYKVDLVELSNGQSVDRRIYPALQEMFDTARANNVYPVVASGYRTAKKQQSLMDEKITAFIAEGYNSNEAVSKAKDWVAIPGTSEHQLGLAVDINADGVNSNGDEVYTWLENNAHTFGFICRYPADKVDITGISYEPWHYRYVGIKAATDIYQQGICLEEYLNAMD